MEPILIIIVIAIIIVAVLISKSTANKPGIQSMKFKGMCIDMSQPQARLVPCDSNGIFNPMIEAQPKEPLLPCPEDKSTPDPTPKDSVVLRDPNSGMCLDIEGCYMDNGTKIRQWVCNGLSAQRFLYKNNMLMAALNTDKCVTVDDNQNVMLMDCNGDESQKWSC